MNKEKINELFNKNKNMRTLYIILIIGVIILFFSGSFTKKSEKTKSIEQTSIYDTAGETERRLEQILGEIRGVGKVKVMITYESSGETVYAADTTNESLSSDMGEGSLGKSQNQVKQSSKLVTASGEPVIRKEQLPEVMGVIVVCEGGDNTKTKADITNALKAVLNIAEHRISVFAGK